jgi:Putative peptidoglycan binding domain
MKAILWGLGGLAFGFVVGRLSRRSESSYLVGQGGYVPPPPPRQPGPIVSFTCGPDPRQSLRPHQSWPLDMYDRIFAWETCLWRSKNQDLVSEVQSFLGRHSHSISGVIDEDLRDKIRGFQSTFHIPITGEIDVVTARAMEMAARARDEEYDWTHSVPSSVSPGSLPSGSY